MQAPCDPQKPWHEVILLGMARAGQAAVAAARATNTKLAIWLDGKVVKMTADEWEAHEKSQKSKQETTEHVSR